LGAPRKNKKGEVIDSISGEEKLGRDLIAELAEKEWAVAPVPTEEELKQEKPKSKMTRTNVNSRKNLMQYRKNKPKEAKEKILENLPLKEKREVVNPFDYIKLPDSFDKEYFKAFLPQRNVLFSAEEEKNFYRILNAFLLDFDITELSASDLEDVVSLAVNRVLESRLLEASVKNPTLLLDISSTIERFRKHSEKVKSNLVSRRSDRIDVKNKQSFSIVDIVNEYDEKKKAEFEERVKKMEDEERSFWEERKNKEL